MTVYSTQNILRATSQVLAPKPATVAAMWYPLLALLTVLVVEYDAVDQVLVRMQPRVVDWP